MNRHLLIGYFCAFGAYLIWGLYPFYWRYLLAVSATEVLAHRILWCIPATLLWCYWHRQWLQLTWLRQWWQSGLLVVSAACVAVNWLTYMLLVLNGRVLEASLGYYLYPLLGIVVGWLIFREALTVQRGAAIACAACGVLWMVIIAGEIPWFALLIAASFAAYAPLRRVSKLDANTGLMVEMLLLAPFALLLLAQIQPPDTLAFVHSGWRISVLLIGGGLIVTFIPMVLYANSTRCVPLIHLSMLFYITPTMLFFDSLLLDEPFDQQRLLGFVFIWIGLGVYSLDMIKRQR